MKCFLGGKIINIDAKCFKPATKIDSSLLGITRSDRVSINYNSDRQSRTYPASDIDYYKDNEFYPCPGDIQKFVDDNIWDLV